MTPGICRYCGCTEESPRYLSSGDTCCWIDAARTVCSAPDCIKRWKDPRRPVEPRKRTTADIHALIRRKGHRKRAGAA